MKDVYLLVDDYTPDAGSTIWGVYSTREKAENALKHLEDGENNEWGFNQNKDNTIDIRCETLQ